jgi:hypothetical protein
MCGASPAHLLEGFPGPPGPARPQKGTPKQSGQTAFWYPDLSKQKHKQKLPPRIRTETGPKLSIFEGTSPSGPCPPGGAAKIKIKRDLHIPLDKNTRIIFDLISIRFADRRPLDMSHLQPNPTGMGLGRGGGEGPPNIGRTPIGIKSKLIPTSTPSIRVTGLTLGGRIFIIYLLSVCGRHQSHKAPSSGS